METLTRNPDRQLITGANVYKSPKNLWVVTTYYNPSGYRTRRDNLNKFLSRIIESRMNWLLVECAFGGDPFTLSESQNVLRVRAEDVMWQKERLLNIAIRALPDTCSKIVWIDCDILFENANWAAMTAELLDVYPVVQPFDAVIRLPRHHSYYHGIGEIYQGFGTCYSREPGAVTTGKYGLHGHTGVAWAAQRDLIESHGLYDKCIVGGGDDLMAHAFCGDWESACLTRSTGGNKAHLADAVEWCRQIYPDVRARVAFVHGYAMHLWHGEIENRRYYFRHFELSELGFNPAVDLINGASGCWAFRKERNDLRAWFSRYFEDRREDG